MLNYDYIKIEILKSYNILLLHQLYSETLSLFSIKLKQSVTNHLL